HRNRLVGIITGQCSDERPDTSDHERGDGSQCDRCTDSDREPEAARHKCSLATALGALAVRGEPLEGIVAMGAVVATAAVPAPEMPSSAKDEKPRQAPNNRIDDEAD